MYSIYFLIILFLIMLLLFQVLLLNLHKLLLSIYLFLLNNIKLFLDYQKIQRIQINLDFLSYLYHFLNN